MTDFHTREQAHEMIDRLAPSQVAAFVGLLQTMLDPVSRAIANAPLDDEQESEEEREAVAASKAWLISHTDSLTSNEDLLAEFEILPGKLR